MKKIIITLLFLTWSKETTGEIKKREITATGVAIEDYIIQEFEKAPYKGVLVPEWNYRHYTSQNDKVDFLTNRLAKIEVELKEEQQRKRSIITPLFIGIALGMAAQNAID